MSVVAVESAAQFEGLDSHKLTVKSYMDYGHLIKGYDYNDPSKKNTITNLPLSRTSVSVIQDMTAGRFDVSVGLSGLVWWPYYGGGANADLSQKIMQVKPMVPVARARWQFGDPGTTSESIMLGTFNYKYNPDAKNLGEYLYRSGTYPGYIWTNDGWGLMNRAGNYSQGLLFTLSQMGGHLKHNASLFMETVYYPVGDFSPGYDFSFVSKWIDFGGGAVFNHYLPLRPSKEVPKDQANTYATVKDVPDPTLPDTVTYTGRLSDIFTDHLIVNPVDTVVLHHWTFKGIKLMGRVALNLGPLLPEEIRGPEDLRIFAEAAVLGVENQPLYYAKRSERIPVMFGVNVPTFKMLDVLSLQGEYYKSPYNDIYSFVQESLPIWSTTKTDSVHSDDFKWSIYAKKAVNKYVSVYAQAASDHFRLTDGSLSPSSIPLTPRSKDWYYLLRLEFSLR